jgi:hypothetical protein
VPSFIRRKRDKCGRKGRQENGIESNLSLGKRKKEKRLVRGKSSPDLKGNSPDGLRSIHSPRLHVLIRCHFHVHSRCWGEKFLNTNSNRFVLFSHLCFVFLLLLLVLFS